MGIPTYLYWLWLVPTFDGSASDDWPIGPVLVGWSVAVFLAGVGGGRISRLGSRLLPGGVGVSQLSLEGKRQQAEEALKQSEILNRAILAALPDLIVRMHRDGTYLDIKPATSFPTDLPNFRVGENIQNVLPPKPAQQYLTAAATALKTGEIQIFEFPLMVRDQQIWQEARVLPLNPDEVLMIVRDLTQRKQAEEALKEREAMLRAIGDNLPKGYIYQRVYEPGKGFYYAYVSAGIERLLGLKPEAVLTNAQVTRTVGFAEDLAIADRAVQESLKNLSPIELQMRNCTAQGEIQWSSIRSLPRRLADGRTVWDGVEVDITDLKRIEAALRASEEQFRRAFDHAPIGISLVSPTGRFLKVNACYCELLGYSEAELLKLHFQDITDPADREADLEGLRQLLTGEIQSFQMRKRYITKQGAIVPVYLNAALVRDENGQPLYSVGHIQDIRDRLKVDRMKDEFISVVSHELRTPLTSIRGALGILETGVFDHKPEQARHMLHIAINNSNRLVRLVDDILCLERLASGKVDLVMEPCQVDELMQQAIDSVQTLADEAGITLSMTPLMTQLWAAPDAIVQTLTNLLGNAIKFSMMGGTVWLVAEWIESGAAQEDSAQWVRFTVKDQGRGIPTDKLEIVFEQFQQVDVSDSRKKGGTGLGLTICKRIVQQHGGQIWAESRLGEGSEFYFTLPVVRTSNKKP
ncbi:MAG: PAS domain S-box protein [Elainella sp. Prado103]|jgi:PAS domain S-box-containing protein|nr:PAS domain S-box protein [Elainella sp. Prado103]